MYEDLGIPPKLEIVGSIGRVVIDEVNNLWTMESREGKNRLEPLGKYDLPLDQRPITCEPLDLIRLLGETIMENLSDAEVSCTGSDGLASLQMIMGFHVSDQEDHVPISLPLSPKYHNMAVDFT
jgi:hypothetical protein